MTNDKYKHFDKNERRMIAGASIPFLSAKKMDAEYLFKKAFSTHTETFYVDKKLIRKEFKKLELVSYEESLTVGRFSKSNIGKVFLRLHLNKQKGFCLLTEEEESNGVSHICVESIYAKGEKELSDASKFLEKIKIEKERKTGIDALSSDHFGLCSRRMEIEKWDNIKLDFDYYNRSFKKFSKKMEGFFNSEESLVCIHGYTGTGKTTYLRYYIRENKDKDFLYVPPNLMGQIGSPAFMDFLSANRGKILILEDAEEALIERGKNFNQAAVSNLLQITDGFLNDFFDIKVIATFNCEIESVDEALLRSGRLFESYEFKKLTKDQAKKAAKKLKKSQKDIDNITEDISLADVFALGEEKKSKPNKQKKEIGFNTK